MYCLRFALPLAGLCVFCLGGVLAAAEADELRSRAKALLKEAAGLAESGDQDRAARLKAEASELLAQAEKQESQRPGPGKDKLAGDAESRLLKQRLQDLRALESKLQDKLAPAGELAKVREQMADTERALHARAGGKPGILPALPPQGEQLEAATRKMHHLRAAAEHLQQADAHDLARQLLQKAEAIEAEIHAAHRPHADAFPKRPAADDRALDALHGLREELVRLREEVQELRRKVDQR